MIILKGGQLLILSDEERNNPELCLNYLNEKEITIATLPPAFSGINRH